MNSAVRLSICEMLCVMALLVLTGGSPVRAEKDTSRVRIQEGTIFPRAGGDLILTREESELTTRINISRRMMAEGNFSGAAAMLEDLYVKNPGNDTIVNLLHQCYQELGQYLKAEWLLEKQIERFPDQFGYRILFAEIQAEQGKRQQALDAYDSTLARLPDGDLLRRRMVLQSMLTREFDSVAAVRIDSMRVRMADSTLFAVERGKILQKRKEYHGATKEFYSLLRDTTSLGNDAEKEIFGLLTFVESAEPAEEALLAEPDFYTSERALKLLSNYYLFSGKYERAFQITLAEDSLAGSDGQALVTYMQRCLDRHLYSQAAAMGDHLAVRYPNSAVRFMGLQLQGAALAKLGRFDDALAVFHLVSDSAPGARDRADALFGMGEVYLEGTFEYDLALMHFDSVVNHFKSGRGYFNSLLAIPECHLRMGHLESSRAFYRRLDQMRMGDDQAEEVDYSLALITFFEKEFDSAEVAFQRLIVEYPRGFYVNDALEMIQTFEKAGEDRSALADFADAMLFEHRRIYDSSRVKLETLTQGEKPPLADVALYRLTNISFTSFQPQRALVYAERLIDSFPDSYFTPYVVKARADWYFERGERLEEIRGVYRDLLRDHANYPFASDVRERLRQLDRPAGSA